jgi:hypothetical protein
LRGTYGTNGTTHEGRGTFEGTLGRVTQAIKPPGTV